MPEPSSFESKGGKTTAPVERGPVLGRPAALVPATPAPRTVAQAETMERAGADRMRSSMDHLASQFASSPIAFRQYLQRTASDAGQIAEAEGVARRAGLRWGPFDFSALDTDPRGLRAVPDAARDFLAMLGQMAGQIPVNSPSLEARYAPVQPRHSVADIQAMREGAAMAPEIVVEATPTAGQRLRGLLAGVQEGAGQAGQFAMEQAAASRQRHGGAPLAQSLAQDVVGLAESIWREPARRSELQAQLRDRLRAEAERLGDPELARQADRAALEALIPWVLDYPGIVTAPEFLAPGLTAKGVAAVRNVADPIADAVRAVRAGDVGIRRAPAPEVSVGPVRAPEPRVETPSSGPQLEGGTPEARERARALGFDPDQTYYHGTNRDVQGGFRRSGSGAMGPGVYMARNPATTDVYAGTPRGPGREIDFNNNGNVLPLNVRGRMATRADWMRALDEAGGYNGYESGEAAQRILREQGFTGVSDPENDFHVVFDPENVRVPWARFDPAQSHSRDLLSAGIPTGGDDNGPGLINRLVDSLRGRGRAEPQGDPTPTGTAPFGDPRAYPQSAWEEFGTLRREYPRPIVRSWEEIKADYTRNQERAQSQRDSGLFNDAENEPSPARFGESSEVDIDPTSGTVRAFHNGSLDRRSGTTADALSFWGQARNALAQHAETNALPEYRLMSDARRNRFFERALQRRPIAGYSVFRDGDSIVLRRDQPLQGGGRFDPSTMQISPGEGSLRNMRGNGASLQFSELPEMWQIRSVDVDPNLRGQGNGVRLYEDFIRRARAAGVPRIGSDVTVSGDAARVYDALRRRGYRVEKNPSAYRMSSSTSGASDGNPLYTIDLTSPPPSLQGGTPEARPIFHGTQADFESFRGPAYFADREADAAEFAGRPPQGLFDGSPEDARLASSGARSGRIISRTLDPNARILDVPESNYEFAREISGLAYDPARIAQYQSQGYDGVRWGNQTLLFDPNRHARAVEGADGAMRLTRQQAGESNAARILQRPPEQQQASAGLVSAAQPPARQAPVSTLLGGTPEARLRAQEQGYEGGDILSAGIPTGTDDGPGLINQLVDFLRGRRPARVARPSEQAQADEYFAPRGFDGQRYMYDEPTEAARRMDALEGHVGNPRRYETLGHDSFSDDLTGAINRENSPDARGYDRALERQQRQGQGASAGGPQSPQSTGWAEAFEAEYGRAPESADELEEFYMRMQAARRIRDTNQAGNVTAPIRLRSDTPEPHRMQERIERALAPREEQPNWTQRAGNFIRSLFEDEGGTLNAGVNPRGRGAAQTGQRVNNAPTAQATNQAGTIEEVLPNLPSDVSEWRTILNAHPWINSPSRAQTLIMATARTPEGAMRYAPADIVNVTGYTEDTIKPLINSARRAGIPVPRRTNSPSGSPARPGGELGHRIVELMERSAAAGRPITGAQIAERLGASLGSVKVTLNHIRSGARSNPELQERLRAVQERLRGGNRTNAGIDASAILPWLATGGYWAGMNLVTDQGRRANPEPGVARQ